jgi:hypothetical protein
MIVEFFFGHATVLSKANRVLMLLRGNPAICLAIALIVSIFIWSALSLLAPPQGGDISNMVVAGISHRLVRLLDAIQGQSHAEQGGTLF